MHSPVNDFHLTGSKMSVLFRFRTKIWVYASSSLESRLQAAQVMRMNTGLEVGFRRAVPHVVLKLETKISAMPRSTSQSNLASFDDMCAGLRCNI
jgi:hypothetical protein